MACERIMAAITRGSTEGQNRQHFRQAYQGLTRSVQSHGLYQIRQLSHLESRLAVSDPRKCHVNYVILDGDWEKGVL